jgi:Uri superfamily endonuclease
MIETGENDEPTLSLPSLPGTYALVLRFSKRLEIVVGRLGVLETQAGYYMYVGSALGPGGLAARVGRHCRREKTLRWHIDYLRAAADLEEVWYATGKSHLECRWASTLLTLPGASVPLTGFGA